ncbi:MAG: hypothetical protein ABI920_16420 [Casimicrobiaceae bacterium]
MRYVGLTGLNSGTTDVMLGQDLPLGPDYPAVPCRVGDLDTYELHPGEGCAIGIVVAYRRESYGRTLLPSARRNEVGRTRDTELRADRATGHPDHCASVAGTG